MFRNPTTDLIIVLDGNAQIKTFNDELITEIGPGSIIGEISLVDEFGRGPWWELSLQRLRTRPANTAPESFR